MWSVKWVVAYNTLLYSTALRLFSRVCKSELRLPFIIRYAQFLFGGAEFCVHKEEVRGLYAVSTPTKSCHQGALPLDRYVPEAQQKRYTEAQRAH